MRCYGLHPEDVLARSPAVVSQLSPTLRFSMVYGALSFAAISVLAYSIWAFQLIRGEGVMYAAVAAIYVGLTGIALSRLVIGGGAMPRFALLFATAFVLYAIAWCAFWFGLKGKHHADLWGSAVGLSAMTFLLQHSFGKRRDFLPLFAVLFTCHTLGYYLGESLYALVRGPVGRLLWGAAHGLGFGAGLGSFLFYCQRALKELAISLPPPDVISFR